MSIPRIYILGAGAIGSLIAHELAVLPVQQKIPEVVLLLKSAEILNHFLKKESKVNVNRYYKNDTYRSTVQLLATDSSPLNIYNKPSPIQNLIVTTKAQQTVKALEKYIVNLTPDSNVLVLQNGMGIIEELYERFWPNSVSDRPNFYQGVITHGVFNTGSFTANHVGMGEIKIASIPDDLNNVSMEYERSFRFGDKPDMIKFLQESTPLKAGWVHYDQLILSQMEKLVVNACINPITAIYGCVNGDLLKMDKYVHIIRPIIRECINVFQKSMKILQQIPTASMVLNEERLMHTVLHVLKMTSDNYSSMYQDVQRLKENEINYINGYIIREGYKNGVFTPYNSMLKNMLILKTESEKLKNKDYVKFKL